MQGTNYSDLGVRQFGLLTRADPELFLGSACYVGTDGKFRVITKHAEKNQIVFVDDESKRRIIDYSNQNNHIVEIYEIKENEHITKFYPYTPLVMIGELGFYKKNIQNSILFRYKRFLQDKIWMNEFYEEVVSEYISFIKATGCYFTDMSGNNLLINGEFLNYKIIDVFSIAKYDSNFTIKFRPYDILLTQKHKKIKKDKTYNEFLQKCGDLIHNISEIKQITYKGICGDVYSTQG